MGPAESTPMARGRAGWTVSDLTLLDMQEAWAAQTMANLQQLGSERCAREVLGWAQATGEVDDAKFTVHACSTDHGQPVSETDART